METFSVKRTSVKAPGFWWWFAQRLTGLFLIFFVLFHGWMTHFVPISSFQSGLQGEVVVYAVVKARLAQGLFVFVDFALLGLALAHGLNGIRNIVLEIRWAEPYRAPITALLWIIGALAFVAGARALLVFIF